MTVRNALLNPLALIGFLTTASVADPGDPSVRQRDTEVMLKGGATMSFQRDVPITLRDGHVVYANIYRPKEQGNYPVILAQTVYGKDPNFRDAYKARFEEMLKNEVPTSANSLPATSSNGKSRTRSAGFPKNMRSWWSMFAAAANRPACSIRCLLVRPRTFTT
jgi:predicted acyl esterase